MYSVKLFCFFLGSLMFVKDQAYANPAPPPPLRDDVIVCGSNYVKITIPTSYINASAVGQSFSAHLSTNLTAPNYIAPGCALSMSGENYIILLNTTAGQCAMTKSNILNQLYFYAYEVHIVPVIPADAVVVRVRKLKISLTCVYTIKVQGSIKHLVPVPKVEHIYIEKEQGNFKVDVSRFTDASFNHTFIVGAGNISDPAARVRIGDRIYIGLWIHVQYNKYLVLQAQTCWVTPTSNPSDSRRMYVIQNGCAASESVSGGGNVVVRNYLDIHVYFYFNSFYWIAERGAPLYTHCNVTVCDSRASSDCKTDPCGRRKRSLNLDHGQQKTLTYGPMFVEPAEIKTNNHIVAETENNEMKPAQKNKKPMIERLSSHDIVCDKVDMGCAYDCAVGDKGAHFCICPPGFKITFNKKGCEQQTEIFQVENAYPIQYVLPTFAALLTTIVMMSILIKKITQIK